MISMHLGIWGFFKILSAKLWDFLGLNFFITVETLFSFPPLASFGGCPCGTGLRPLGTPFLRLASALLCTGIDDPWCLLIKPIKQY